jgi:two-component system, LytTR family, response regulator LytT
MNCLIIDDEATSRLILSRLCADIEDLDVIDTFAHPMEAIKFLNKEDVDLIFLDIHMPGFSGFDFIDTLKSPPQIILTTSDSTLAIEAFGYQCIIDYLLKPISPERFAQAIDKVKAYRSMESREASSGEPSDQKNKNNDTLFVNIDRTLIKIQTASITHIEASKDYILIKTADQEYKVHSTLKKILSKLSDDRFFQIHRSYIINLTRIVDIQDNTVLIEKNVIPISRSKRPEFLRKLDLL